MPTMPAPEPNVKDRRFPEPRPVAAPAGTVYASINEAARAFKVRPNRVLRWVRAGRYGWRYVVPAAAE
jgi:hypothetical protein